MSIIGTRGVNIMAWGKEWPKIEDIEKILKHDTGITPELLGVHIHDASCSSYNTPAFTAVQTPCNCSLSKKEYNNKVPTHDPYTNPDAYLYYECKCGAKLDPHTKRFAELNNHASEKGWKIRWNLNGQGYEPFCVECGKDVE